MDKHLSKIWIILLLPILLLAENKELRGTWFAWAGSNFPSKTEIARQMEALAAANFNTVYVDVWRYGFPYFRSEVFYNLTGMYTDPNLDEGRDILADFIAEGHRVGLEVEAWFEAGFAACVQDNIHLFNSHRHWFAQKTDGTYDFYADGGIRYYWLSHCNEEAQQFLIALVMEVARNYDVDGIEFDRVRYPDLNCGYDSATVELYKAEHNGNPPPQAYWDASWKRWRADKLTEFMAVVYDSIKSVNPKLTVSNAPLWYGYDQFCQDYGPWINEGHLDVVVPQIYYASHASYVSRLDDELQKVNDKSKFYPGMSTVANTVVTPPGELIQMIESTRARDLEGHVIWYHNNLGPYYDTLKATVYAEKAELPYRSADYRPEAIIVHETDSLVKKSTNWKTYSTFPGFQGNGNCLYTNNSSGEWIEYYAPVPKSDWYEVYAFIPIHGTQYITHWNAHPAAEYVIYHQDGQDTIHVAQHIWGHGRWYKLGDFYLPQGDNQKIIRLSDANLGSHILFTDAIMLLKTNRLIEQASAIKKKDDPLIIRDFELLSAFPNPFNSRTTIRFALNQRETILIRIYNSAGQLVDTLSGMDFSAGRHKIIWDAAAMSSGVYVYSVTTAKKTRFGKVVLIR